MPVGVFEPESDACEVCEGKLFRCIPLLLDVMPRGVKEEDELYLEERE